MTRLPLPLDTAWRSGERQGDLVRIGVLVAAALLLVLFTLSDVLLAVAAVACAGVLYRSYTVPRS